MQTCNSGRCRPVVELRDRAVACSGPPAPAERRSRSHRQSGLHPVSAERAGRRRDELPRLRRLGAVLDALEAGGGIAVHAAAAIRLLGADRLPPQRDPDAALGGSCGWRRANSGCAIPRPGRASSRCPRRRRKSSRESRESRRIHGSCRGAGRARTLSGIFLQWRRARSLAGLDSVRLHDLRHTASPAARWRSARACRRSPACSATRTCRPPRATPTHRALRPPRARYRKGGGRQGPRRYRRGHLAGRETRAGNVLPPLPPRPGPGDGARGAVRACGGKSRRGHWRGHSAALIWRHRPVRRGGARPAFGQDRTKPSIAAAGRFDNYRHCAILVGTLAAQSTVRGLSTEASSGSKQESLDKCLFTES